MDWGLIMAGALGGGAKATGELADTEIKNRDTAAAEQRVEQRAIQGERRRMGLQREQAVFEMDLKLKDEDRKRTQSAADGQAINDGAREINRGRMAGLINSSNGSSMTAEDAKVLENNPEAQKAYGITPRSRAQEYDDQASAAGRLGLDGKMKDIRGQQDVELKRTAEERRLTADENKVIANAAETRRREKHDEDWRNAQAARDATNNRRLESILAGKDTSQKSEKVMTYMEGRRKEIAAESMEVNKLMAADLKNAEFGTPEEKAAIKESYRERIDGVAKERRQMDSDFAHLRGKFDLPALPAEKAATKPAAMNALPAGAKQIGTSGGKPVYQTPDGKKFVAN